MKWLALLIPILMSLILPLTVLADTSDGVVITARGEVVAPPGDFTVTYISDYEILITWTKPASANNTMIRAKYGSWPSSRTDGYLVYYGTGNSTTDNSVSLDHSLTDVHYVAWSETDEGEWSPNTSQGRIGGAAMQIAIILAILGLTGLAFWRNNPLLYMVSFMGWLFLTFYLVNQYYPEENEYLQYAIAVVCISMALVLAVMIVRHYLQQYSDGRRRPSSDEIQRKHRDEVTKLTRPKPKRPWFYE